MFKWLKRRKIKKKINHIIDWSCPIQLFPHQKTAIQKIIENYEIDKDKGFILTDEPGLGKTFTSIFTYKYYEKELELIIFAPANNHFHWKNTLEKFNIQKFKLFSYGELSRQKPEWLVWCYHKTFFIFDECHKLRKKSSNRHKNALRLSRNSQECLFLGMTGTPSFNGNIEEIINQKEILKTNKLWGRKKEDVIKLPKHKKYKKKIILIKSSKKILSNADFEIKSFEEFLYQQKLESFHKAISSIDEIKKIAKRGKTLVFCKWVSTAKEINRLIKGSKLITGGIPKNQREKIYKDLNNQVLILTIGTSSESLNLQHYNQIIFIDRPWTSGEMNQCQNRVHRIGQEDKVIEYWFYSGWFDQKIDKLIEAKNKSATLLTRGKAESFNVRESWINL